MVSPRKNPGESISSQDSRPHGRILRPWGPPRSAFALAGVLVAALLCPTGAWAGWITNVNSEGPNTRIDGVFQHIAEIDTSVDASTGTLTFRVALDGSFSPADPYAGNFNNGLLGTIEIDAGKSGSGQTLKVQGLNGSFTTDYYISLDSEDPFVGSHTGLNQVDVLTGDSTYVDTVAISYDFADNLFSVTVPFADIGGSGNVNYGAFVTTPDGTSMDQFAVSGSDPLSTEGTVSAVAEPSSLTLLAVGGLGLLAPIWRRRHS